MTEETMVTYRVCVKLSRTTDLYAVAPNSEYASLGKRPWYMSSRTPEDARLHWEEISRSQFGPQHVAVLCECQASGNLIVFSRRVASHTLIPIRALSAWIIQGERTIPVPLEEKDEQSATEEADQSANDASHRTSDP